MTTTPTEESTPPATSTDAAKKEHRLAKIVPPGENAKQFAVQVIVAFCVLGIAWSTLFAMGSGDYASITFPADAAKVITLTLAVLFVWPAVVAIKRGPWSHALIVIAVMVVTIILTWLVIFFLMRSAGSSGFARWFWVSVTQVPIGWLLGLICYAVPLILLAILAFWLGFLTIPERTTAAKEEVTYRRRRVGDIQEEFDTLGEQKVEATQRLAELETQLAPLQVELEKASTEASELEAQANIEKNNLIEKAEAEVLRKEQEAADAREAAAAVTAAEAEALLNTANSMQLDEQGLKDAAHREPDPKATQALEEEIDDREDIEAAALGLAAMMVIPDIPDSPKLIAARQRRDAAQEPEEEVRKERDAKHEEVGELNTRWADKGHDLEEAKQNLATKESELAAARKVSRKHIVVWAIVAVLLFAGMVVTFIGWDGWAIVH